MTNPADMRALIAVELRGQEIQMQLPYRNGFTLDTWDAYLAAAQQLLESSWNPNNYKHPAGMDDSKLGVSEAIALLQQKGYVVTSPPESASQPPG
jgi:hypothetical protein